MVVAVFVVELVEVLLGKLANFFWEREE